MIEQEIVSPWLGSQTFNSKSIQHEMAQQGEAWLAIAGLRPSVKLIFSYIKHSDVLTTAFKPRADG